MGRKLNMDKEELKLILQEGEGYKIEFKESISNIDKDIVSFGEKLGTGFERIRDMQKRKSSISKNRI